MCYIYPKGALFCQVLRLKFLPVYNCLALLPRLFIIGYVHGLEAAYTLRKPGRNCEMPAEEAIFITASITDSNKSNDDGL